MNDALFVVMLCLVTAIGVVSIALVRIGIGGITDRMIKSLFNYILALILALMAVSLLFVAWISASDNVNLDGISSGPLMYAFLVSVFAIVVGSALAVKRTGDMYGFRIKDKLGPSKGVRK